MTTAEWEPSWTAYYELKAVPSLLTLTTVGPSGSASSYNVSLPVTTTTQPAAVIPSVTALPAATASPVVTKTVTLPPLQFPSSITLAADDPSLVSAILSFPISAASVRVCPLSAPQQLPTTPYGTQPAPGSTAIPSQILRHHTHRYGHSGTRNSPTRAHYASSCKGRVRYGANAGSSAYACRVQWARFVLRGHAFSLVVQKNSLDSGLPPAREYDIA